MKNYRKIYETLFGIIPIDEYGRTYEIHHIDGNHSNNEPDNLLAASIQEHYDIYYAQEDWSSCLLIAERMGMLPEEKSKLARENALNQVLSGTHPFLGGEIQRQTAQKQIASGTHNLLKRSDGTSLTSDRVSDGTHPFLGGEVTRRTNQRRVEEGTHNFQGSENNIKNNKKRIEAGTHHFLGANNPSLRRIENGTHHFLTNNPNKNMPQVTCPHCGKTGGRNNMKRWHFNNCKGKL